MIDSKRSSLCHFAFMTIWIASGIGLSSRVLAQEFSSDVAVKGSQILLDGSGVPRSLAQFSRLDPELQALLGERTGSGGSIDAIQLKNQLKRWIDTIREQGIQAVDGVDLIQLAQAIDNAEIQITDRKLYLQDHEGKPRPVDGINWDSGQKVLLSTANVGTELNNSDFWQFALHEILGLIGELDADYRKSSQLLDVIEQIEQQRAELEIENQKLKIEIANFDEDQAMMDRAKSGVPTGWNIESINLGTYRSLRTAMRRCQFLAEDYFLKYRKVVCEPLLRNKTMIKRWTEVLPETRYVGMEVDVFNGSVNVDALAMLGLQLNANAVDVDTTPIMEDRHRVVQKLEEVPIAFYGYRILVSQPLVLNREPFKEVVNGEWHGLTHFASPLDAIDYCNEEHYWAWSRSGYVGRCVAQELGNNRWTFAFMGRKKYVDIQMSVETSERSKASNGDSHE